MAPCQTVVSHAGKYRTGVGAERAAMQQRNYLFDALRGIAALMVVAYHFDTYGYSFAPSGFLAVDVFFVLSGFVIAQAYTRRLAGGLSAGHFMLLRAVRLYPLIALGFLLGLAKAICTYLLELPSTYPVESVLEAAPFNLLVLPAPGDLPDLFPPNGPAWSLFFELVANAVFAIWGFRARRLALVAVACLSAILTIAVARASGTMNIGWDWASFMGGMGRVGFGFTIGVLMHAVLGTQERRETCWAFLPLAAIVVLFAWHPATPWALTCWIAGGLVLGPVIVAICAKLELPSHMHKVASFLGDISYPVYAIHFPLLTGFKFALPKLGIPFFAMPLIVLPTLAVLGFLVARYYDAPVRRWLSHRLNARESAKPRIVG